MFQLHPHRRRLVAAVAAAVLVTGGATACGGSADDDTTDAATPAGPGPVDLAAGWVVDNRNDDGLLEVTTSYEGKTSTSVDVGSSIDLVLGLDATGLHAKEVAETTDAVADNLETYVGAGREVYAGPSAKALLLAVDQGRDPADFGGLDLQARVEGTVAARGATAGRLQDRSEYGDYANSIGQAYAVAALTRLDSEQADEVTDFLLLQQCEAGFFRLAFSAAKAADQSCDADDSVAPEQAPDTTALVALQLAVVDPKDEDVATALEDATAWLLAQQAEDGSFADPQNGTNANTTGLAGWALAELGEDGAAARAASWLRDLQVVDEEGELAGETGAVAYDEASLADARTHGLDDPLDRSPWLVAGVQAFPALAAVPADGDSE